MKLTEEQIKGITFGAVKIERSEDGYHFFEYIDKQLAFFASLVLGKSDSRIGREKGLICK